MSKFSIRGLKSGSSAFKPVFKGYHGDSVRNPWLLYFNSAICEKLRLDSRPEGAEDRSRAWPGESVLMKINACRLCDIAWIALVPFVVVILVVVGPNLTQL